MSVSRPLVIVSLLLCASLVGLLSMLAGGRQDRPYALTQEQLTGWTIVSGQGSDPWVLALRPPESVADALYAQLTTRSGVTRGRPTRTELPLVLRDEDAEGLQGVFGIETLTEVARDAGLDTATLTPVCIAHRLAPEGEAELVFVVFDAVEFQQMRRNLIPTFPEHAGTGIYDPGTLTPVLPIAASNPDLARWWPLRVNRDTDCLAPIHTVKSRP
jgi:hypothetical protein